MGNIASKIFTRTFSALERLPLPILEDICEYLAQNESNRKSLFAFALTSRRCCEAAERQRFERILIVQGNVRKLEQDLKTWNAMLGVHERARYVRRVKVSGCLLVKGWKFPWWTCLCPCKFALDTKELAAIPRRRRRALYAWEMLPIGLHTYKTYGTGSTTGEENEDDTKNGVQTSNGVPGGHTKDGNEISSYGDVFLASEAPKRPEYIHVPEDVANRQNEAWTLIAAFIAQFPGLKDFMWDTTDSFPRSVLSTIHNDLPRCRIHVSNFCLRSLLQDKRDLYDIDIDDYALATSPCLYSLSAEVECINGYDNCAHVDYNKEAIWQMASGLAPNLRSIHLSNMDVISSPYRSEVARTPRPKWRGLVDERREQGSVSTTTSPKGSLYTLMLTCDFGLSVEVEDLWNWSNRIHFSKLHHLELGKEIRLPTMRLLAQMALRRELRSLRILKLPYISTSKPDYNKIKEASSLLLASLNPLQDIQMRPIGEETLCTVLERHGATLQKLDIHDPVSIPLSSKLAKDLAEQCPILKHLEVRISRTEGDLHDEDIIQMLGSLGYLKYLRANEYVRRGNSSGLAGVSGRLKE